MVKIGHLDTHEPPSMGGAFGGDSGFKPEPLAGQEYWVCYHLCQDLGFKTKDYLGAERAGAFTTFEFSVSGDFAMPLKARELVGRVRTENSTREIEGTELNTLKVTVENRRFPEITGSEVVTKGAR